MSVTGNEYYQCIQPRMEKENRTTKETQIKGKVIKDECRYCIRSMEIERLGDKTMMKLPPLPELSPEEKKMPLAKYYMEAYPPEPLKQQLIDAGPMDPGDAIPADDFLDLLRPEGYRTEFGYCLMPDGTGYIALYERSVPGVTGQMMGWYVRWMNFYSKSMVPGQGNLRYKLWMPYDHLDHSFVNGKDPTDGINTLETLDIGAGSRPVACVRRNLDLKQLGFTDKMEKELADAGCRVSAAWETFEIPGSHICLSITRPCPWGGTETLSREWIGWKPGDGKLVRDDFPLCSEEYLKNVVIHNTIEHAHLPRFLPQLYAEYKDRPIDAD